MFININRNNINYLKIHIKKKERRLTMNTFVHIFTIQHELIHVYIFFFYVQERDILLFYFTLLLKLNVS